MARDVSLLRLVGHLAGIGHSIRLCDGQLNVGSAGAPAETTRPEIDGAFLAKFDEASMHLGR